MMSKDSLLWKKAMQEEFGSLIKNKTWKLVNKPEECRVEKCKWVFKRQNGSQELQSG